MRTFFVLAFFLLFGCNKTEPTVPLVVKQKCIGSTDSNDTEWNCRTDLVADDPSNFEFNVEVVYRGVAGVYQSLVLEMPDGYSLVFSFTIMCRWTKPEDNCVPYFLQVVPPRHSRLAVQEVPGWVIRLTGAPQKFTYRRQGGQVVVEFDGVSQDRFEFQLPPHNHPTETIPVTVQAHRLWANVTNLKLTPLP